MESNNDTSTKETIFQAFSEWLISEGKSENTIKTYIGVLSQFEGWCPGEFKEAGPVDIQNYLDYLEESQKSAGTIEKHYMAINVFYKFLGQPQVMLHIDRKLKEQKQEVPESLSLQEQERLLKDLETEGNLRNIAMVFVMLHTGVRVSELCDLNCSDVLIEGDKKYIVVRNAKGEVDRSIPLSNEAVQRLQAYLASVKEKEQKTALFISSYGQRMTPRSVQYMLKKFDVHPHKLRHTFCQQLINKGIDLPIVSKLAGHKDLNMTKRYLIDKKMDLDDAIDQTFSKF